MQRRAYWQGQIRISLVQLSVSLMTATRRSSQMPLHEYDRVSGSRIHHRDITEDGTPVPADNIIKGYEIAKNDVVLLEEDEIKGLKLPSSDVFEIDGFIPVDAMPLYYIERPYYVLPEGKNAAEIYYTFHEALLKSGKMGIGQLALRGREELCALSAIEEGLVLETLRYRSELVDPVEAYPERPGRTMKADYIKMAEQLIAQNTHPFDLSRYHDHYHEALADLVEAKKEHRKPPSYARPAPREKVIDFMDALKKSLKAGPDKTKNKTVAPKGRKHKVS